MRIVWNTYIREQLHWAESLSALASEADNGAALKMRAYADRARANAEAVKSVTQDQDGLRTRP